MQKILKFSDGKRKISLINRQIRIKVLKLKFKKKWMIRNLGERSQTWMNMNMKLNFHQCLERSNNNFTILFNFELWKFLF